MEDMPDPAMPEPQVKAPGAAFRAGRFLLRLLWETVRTVLPAILIALFINLFLAQATVVRGQSMEPNLYNNQRVVVEKITYRFFHGPRRGDVVILQQPERDELLIKRVVGLPGETIEIKDGQVLIDSHPLKEPWGVREGGMDYPPTYVPPLHLFVLGDNRGRSEDSRSFGPVPVDNIVGHAWLTYWPLEQIELIR